MSHVKIILYKQKTLKNGTHPVMLYIYEEKPYRLSLGYSALPKDFDVKKGRFRKNYPNAKSKNLILSKQELKAKEIIDNFIREGERFCYDTFKELFKGVKKKKKYFYEFFEEMIEEKKSLGKVGTAKAYKDAYNTLKKYQEKDFSFDKFNYKLLKGLETFLFARGNTGGGIGVRMRSIRAIYYEAVRRGYADKEQNPYSSITNKNGYSLAKLKSSKNPKALTQEELEKFKNFDIEAHPELADSWRYFMFSFKMFGMNFIDICNLKKENHLDNRIHYTRQKTGKSFSLLVSDEVGSIIENFKTDTIYIFPIFDQNIHITAKQKKDRSEKVLKRVNKGLKEIAAIQNIQTHITFYTARHTSATTMKRKGVSTDIISEALGHSNLEVTQHYLGKFENEILDNAIINL